MIDNYHKKKIVFAQFANRLPPHILSSFSEAQIESIQQALEPRSWQQHPVDIRLSIPFLGRRFYLVFVAGKEKRSSERLAKENTFRQFWTPSNMLLIFLVIVSGILSLLGLLYLSSNSLAIFKKSSEVAPVGIPFKRDKASCEESGRIWQDDRCIDYEHDPIF